MVYFIIGIAITIIGMFSATIAPAFGLLMFLGIGLVFLGLYDWIKNGYPHQNSKKEHSKESYRSYINLKDYPVSNNPYYIDSTTYKAIIAFIKKTNQLIKERHPQLSDLPTINNVQLANLIMNEGELPLNLNETNEKDLVPFVYAYILYYLSVRENKILLRILKDTKNADYTNKLIKNARKRFIATMLIDLRHSDEDWFNDNIKFPDYPHILEDVADEMSINNPLETPFYEPR